MEKEKWKRNRTIYIKDMFWRYKTVKCMEKGQYLAYGIFEKNANILDGEMPYEIIWIKFDQTSFVSTWKADDIPNQDDLRGGLDMSKSIIVYTDKEGVLPTSFNELIF